MKKIGLRACIIFLIASVLNGQDFYDINTINNIEITFQESNWDYLLDNLVSAGNEERLMGSVNINGEVFDSVGVRYKGNSSYRSNQVKNPLNIKLDYIIDDQEIQDYGTVKLANVYKDPSFVRETLAYEIARKYFPASQSNYAKVSINGTYLGLYTSDQDVDKYFMRSNFGSDENARIKGEISSNAMPGSMGGVWQYYGTDSSDYFGKYALESDEGWGELVEFLDTLNNYTDDVEQVLNVDRHLWFLAFQNLLVNLDGPINNPQNYYLYQDDLGRFNPIPWDFNECFGVFTNLQSAGPQGTYQLQRLSPFVNMNESDYPVISKILTNDEYNRMYVAHMKTMLNDVILNGWYHDRVLELQDIIATEVQADPNKFYTYSNFLSNIDNSISSGGPHPSPGIIGITELMETRATYIFALSEFSAQAPEIGASVNNPSQVSAGSALTLSATADNATSVSLRYRESVSQPFQILEMLDDGLNGDSLAGDNIYGSGEIIVNSDLQYYFYAENSGAGAFLPEHAEHEFLSIAVISDVVINEFLADNETVIADQDGEYDDWIELYNNTDDEISLEGYFLSDDGTDLTQWSFPDTSIPSNGFLMIWADNDEEQSGLHANFKISASGEILYLLNADTMMVNEVSFSEQVDDSSWGRYPDGLGSFGRMTPTFNSTNQILTHIDEHFSALPDVFILSQNFPNPFNPSTTLRYHLPESEIVTLIIYDIQGRVMKSVDTGTQQNGWHQFTWDGLDDSGAQISTGVYLARVQAGSHADVVKMIFLK